MCLIFAASREAIYPLLMLFHSESLGHHLENCLLLPASTSVSCFRLFCLPFGLHLLASTKKGNLKIHLGLQDLNNDLASTSMVLEADC